MTGRRILVADSNETARKNIEGLLARKGYKAFSASDGAGAIRMARTIYPDLVLLDTGLWGQNAFDVADIIESDGLSSVVFMTARLTPDFYSKLRQRRLYAYIGKPVQPEELYRTVAFSLKTVELIHGYLSKINQLENALAERKAIDSAKKALMKSMNLSEEEAYQKMRRESMDRCLSMATVARRILETKA